MRSILFILLLTISFTGSAQFLGGYADAVNLSDILRASPSELHKMTGEAYGTIGTPNVFEEFRSGHIYFSNKSLAKNLPINYDCFNDRVLLSKGEVDYILDKRMIDYLEFPEEEGKSIVFKQVFAMDLKKPVFMKLLYSGESKLYKHIYKSFQEADYTGPYSQDKRYDEYINNYAWYIELPGSDLQRFRPKKKSILQLMDSHSTEIEKFLKKEKPDLKTEEGITKLVEYYDGTLKQ